MSECPARAQAGRTELQLACHAMACDVKVQSGLVHPPIGRDLKHATPVQSECHTVTST